MKEKILVRQFARYVSLNICGMIGLSCYILADTYFVSKGLGASGLAALNLAIPVYSLVHGCGLMLGMGGATKYSVYVGQKECKNADNLFQTRFIYYLYRLLYSCWREFFWRGGWRYYQERTMRFLG